MSILGMTPARADWEKVQRNHTHNGLIGKVCVARKYLQGIDQSGSVTEQVHEGIAKVLQELDAIELDIRTYRIEADGQKTTIVQTTQESINNLFALMSKVPHGKH